jgi:hypothetical protein
MEDLSNNQIIGIDIELNDQVWTADIERLLFIMQKKSMDLSKYYKKKSIKYRKLSNQFKMPIIIFSSIATFTNFSLATLYFSVVYIHCH